MFTVLGVKVNGEKPYSVIRIVALIKLHPSSFHSSSLMVFIEPRLKKEPALQLLKYPN